MRTLLVLILLAVGAWWGYQQWWIKAPPPWQPLTAPDPVAWKIVNEYGGGITQVVVVLVDGNRWRTEMRILPYPRIFVMISNGITIVKSNRLLDMREGDPRKYLSENFNSWKNSNPLRTDQIDGQACWVYNDLPDSLTSSGEVWISKETRFPVFFSDTLKSGGHVVGHIRLLNSDFNILDKTAFNVNNTIPMLAPFLNANYN
jgi:hypothetical protein